MLFERLHTPEDLYNFKLGAALKMENTVLDMLDKNAEETHNDQLRQLFRHHQDETRQQIVNIERVFAAFGWEVDDSPCPSMEALEKEQKANIKMSDDAIVDNVILGGATETEHHEIGVYETLIINARALGRDDVIPLLQQNLEMEQHTLEEVKNAAQQMIVAGGGARPAAP
jgi:ferritin-like metal-binding protein YciE